jgi:AcrR family transcriptional regulator
MSAAVSLGGGRAQILDSAAWLFRERGYASVTMREIAFAAGMKAGSLYYHFTSKDDIVTEVLNFGVEAVFALVRERVDALPQGTPATLVFEAAVTAHMESLLGLQAYTSANTRIFAQVPGHVRTRTLPVREAYERYWDGLFKRMCVEGAVGADKDLRLARLFLFGAMNGALEWFNPEGELPAAALGRRLALQTLQGLAARAA